MDALSDPASRRAVALAAARRVLDAGGSPAVELDLETGAVLAVHDVAAFLEHPEGMPAQLALALASLVADVEDVLDMTPGEDVLVVGYGKESGARVARVVEVLTPTDYGAA